MLIPIQLTQQLKFGGGKKQTNKQSCEHCLLRFVANCKDTHHATHSF
jgi:hypothetical protein